MPWFSVQLTTPTIMTVTRARSSCMVLVCTRLRDLITFACVYSSETRVWGVWGEITSSRIPDSYVRGEPRPPLVGNTLYWLLANHHIVGFDLDKHSFDLVEKVPHVYYQTILVSAEDELGCAGVDGFSLHFWSRVASIDGAVTWTRRRVVDLEKLLAAEVVAACMLPVEPVGYAEDADVIFIYVDPGTYMIRLKSMQITEVSDKGPYTHIFPYTSFYTPGITGGAGEDQAELLNGT
uniref:F-box protein AT5G49610-like beta-propeller domain-containing protein n=1 Tax=Aegilops tauschii TaxID=37682 RepID=R7VYX1_AEGTA